VYICPVCQCTYTHPGNFKQHLLKHEREQQQQQQQRPLESSHLNNVLQSAFGKQQGRRKQTPDSYFYRTDPDPGPKTAVKQM
jgi:hypothetical protein